MNSELRAIAGYLGLYSITEDGRVWSHLRTARGSCGSRRAVGGRWLRPALVRGYPVVHLASPDGSGMRNFYVHRLVAETWNADVASAGNQVNHRNGEKTQANITNLEWCSPSYNMAHSYAIGLRAQRRRFSDVEVCAIRTARATGETIRSLAARFKAPVSTVWLAAEKYHPTNKE